MTPHLFVYGTLMPAAQSDYGRKMRDRLARESQHLGPATMAGRLYDLGRYPGLFAPQAPSDIVHGGLLRLATPAATLTWLDAYEGVRPADVIEFPSETFEYERVEAQATTADGRSLTAWVYRCRLPVMNLTRITTGRWTG